MKITPPINRKLARLFACQPPAAAGSKPAPLCLRRKPQPGVVIDFRTRKRVPV